jgi:hypothetical protein
VANVAALLLQGSVQVYSRKVEYLYNLVLHALDFLSQKRYLLCLFCWVLIVCQVPFRCKIDFF